MVSGLSLVAMEAWRMHNTCKASEKREKGEIVRKKMCRVGKRIFSKVVGKIFNNYMT